MTDEKRETLWSDIWSGGDVSAWEHPLTAVVRGLITSLGLVRPRVLEVGCGAGGMQTVAEDYTGTDISPSSARYLRPPARFLPCSASKMPFQDRAFDFVFSVYVLEHVAEIDAALEEIRRVTAPDGYIYLKPAWFCRPWNGQEWMHKHNADLTPAEHFKKRFVTVRNSLPYRMLDLLQWRTRGIFGGLQLRTKKLSANYNLPHIGDADAEHWLDPLDMIKWFERHGDVCISHPKLTDRWLKTSDGILVRRSK